MLKAFSQILVPDKRNPALRVGDYRLDNIAHRCGNTKISRN